MQNDNNNGLLRLPTRTDPTACHHCGCICPGDHGMSLLKESGKTLYFCISLCLMDHKEKIPFVRKTRKPQVAQIAQIAQTTHRRVVAKTTKQKTTKRKKLNSMPLLEEHVCMDTDVIDAVME